MRQYKDPDVRICLRKMLGHFELSDEKLAAEPVAKAHGIPSMTKQVRTSRCPSPCHARWPPPPSPPVSLLC